MHDLFRGFVPRPTTELKALWKQAFIVLDTCVLLDLYAASPETRRETLEILSKLQDRLWMPDQVRAELAANRREATRRERARYRELRKGVQELEQKLPELSEIAKRQLQEACGTIIGVIDEVEPDWKQPDEVDTALAELFQDRVGPAYPAATLVETYARGQARYQHTIPPGYGDLKKGIPDCYGDYLIWCQILDEATRRQQPVILVTNDKKEDWWLKDESGMIGPRPELVTEMRYVAGVDFHLYTGKAFVEHAADYVHETLSPQVKDELTRREAADEAEAIEQAGRDWYREYNRELYEKLFGMSPAEAVGGTLSNFLYPSTLSQRIAEFQRIAELTSEQTQRASDVVRRASLFYPWQPATPTGEAPPQPPTDSAEANTGRDGEPAK